MSVSEPVPREELQSSVEIAESAKGPRVTCKVYNVDPEAAREEACRVYADTVAWLEARGLRSPV